MPMLLLENDALLRRTVMLTARTLGLAEIHETGSSAVARRMLRERSFRGAVVSLDFGTRKYHQYDLSLIDDIRTGTHPGMPSMPIAVLLDRCDAPLLLALRERGVTRVILKPFRARVLLETFSEFITLQPA